MQFHVLAIFAALMAATQAFPVAGNLEARNSVNDCGDSTFENQSSTGSPLISDCQIIISNIAGGGTWTVGMGGEHHQLVQYGSCAFGINGDGSANAAYIGNQDIMDLINESIKRFAWEGKVGAKGRIGCQSLMGLVSGASMTWGLYHN